MWPTWSAADPSKPGLCPPLTPSETHRTLTPFHELSEQWWELMLMANGSVRVVGGPLTCHALAKKKKKSLVRGKRACEVVIMCPIYLVHYNIWETSLKTMAQWGLPFWLYLQKPTKSICPPGIDNGQATNHSGQQDGGLCERETQCMCMFCVCVCVFTPGI